MLEDLIEKARAYGAEACELFVQEATVSNVKFQHNRLKSVESNQTHGLGVRVLADGRLGFGAASDLAKTRLLVQAAVDAAQHGEEIEIAFPASSPSINVLKLEDERVRELSSDDLAESAGKAIKKLNEYDPAILAFGGLGKGDLRIRIVNTAGFDAEYKKTLLWATVGGELVEGSNILFCYRDSASTAASIDFDELTARVIRDFEMSRVNVEIEGGPKTVVFTPRAMAALFDVLRLGVNGRNVEKATSPIRGKLGEKILDERMTLIEDGLLEEAIGSAPFDDEGTVLERKTVVDRGVLRSFAVDLRTSPKLDLPPSGNGFRIYGFLKQQTYEAPPSPQSTNWLLTSGEKSYDEMLADVKEGVVVDLMMGLFTGNLLSGDFSANLSLAYRIKEGKIVGRIKNAMVSGNFYEIFRDRLIALSRETERVTEGFATGVFPYLCASDVTISA